MLSQRLNQKQVQKLAMTQQMQQSIKVLKYNADELNSYIKQKELENPFIKIKYSPSSSRSLTDISQFATSDVQPSLDDYLLDQVRLTMRKTPIRTMVVYFIENLDDNGYLTLDLEHLITKDKLDKTLVMDALTLLQQLDPPGIGARNLQECLILQTEFDKNAPSFTLTILKNDFEDFINKKWDKIAHKYHITLSKINLILQYIRTLSPAPGAIYKHSKTEYIYPDLNVTIKGKKVKISLTNYSFPHIEFRDDYFESLVNNTDQTVQKFIKEKQYEFKELSNELIQRETTILNVGQAIINYQLAFFTHHDHPLKPLLLRDIAQKLQLHESTVSRAVNGKYLKTDFGIFELKSFFSNAINKKEDENISANEAQKQMIKLIKNEDKHFPLSDQKIVTLLAEKGITLSRRTVAKYRTKLDISSSSKRKIL